MQIGGFPIGGHAPFFLIAGPCVIEGKQFALDTAGEIKSICDAAGINVVYKSSFDKANRSSYESPRGPGLHAGLTILDEVRRQIGVPVLTDVHSIDQVQEVASVVDVLQTPAFLCRQTDLIQAVAASGKAVNIKKGQFLSPPEMNNVAAKAKAAGGAGRIMVCERGASFGYNNLVVDMRSLVQMRDTGCPVIFDATHSVQLPGGLGERSGGQREFVPVLARAAAAVGVAGIFMETHPRPSEAWSDGPNAVPLGELAGLLDSLQAIDALIKQTPTERAGG